MDALTRASERRQRQGRSRLNAWHGSLMDCGEDGCGLCRVCRHYAFAEWAGMVAPRDPPSTPPSDRQVLA